MLQEISSDQYLLSSVDALRWIFNGGQRNGSAWKLNTHADLSYLSPHNYSLQRHIKHLQRY